MSHYAYRTVGDFGCIFAVLQSYLNSQIVQIRSMVNRPICQPETETRSQTVYTLCSLSYSTVFYEGEELFISRDVTGRANNSQSLRNCINNLRFAW